MPSLRTEGTRITLTVNGREHDCIVEPRWTLADVLREQLGLVGTHLGCEHGICGACTVLVEGQAMRSCLVFAVQLDRASVTTVEGLADGAQLHPLQEAFWECNAFQCGFCTPGFLLSAMELIETYDQPTEDQIREWLGGHLCRCTGYATIVDAVHRAAERRDRDED